MKNGALHGRHHDTQHDDIRHNDIQHNNKNDDIQFDYKKKLYLAH